MAFLTLLSGWIDLRFRDALEYLANHIMSPVYDMKEIQGDINTLSLSEKCTLEQKAQTDYDKACEAGKAETDGNQKEALKSGVRYLEAISRHTAKSIFEQQNDELLLKCLVAQRNEYSFVKKVAAWKGMLTVIFALISVLSSWLDIDWLTALSSLMAVSVLIFTKHIDTFINVHKKHASEIQQYFDVVLYSGVLNNSKTEWGPLPTRSDIADAVSKIDTSVFGDVMNWYSDYSTLTAEQQVFYCQKVNVRWDRKLLQEYKIFQIIFLTAVSAAMIIVFFLVNPTLIKSICVISWFIPIADYVVTNYSKMDSDIKRLDELEKCYEELEQNFSSDNSNDINTKLISIQHRIKDSRENSFLIPDWFYNCRQLKHQKREDHIANVIQKMSNN